MSKLERVTAKLFAGNADRNQIGQFGSAKLNTPTNTTDISEIQELSAYDNGWGDAIISNRNFPPMEEVNGVLKTISYQTCYLLQEGIPEYDIGTTYSNTSIVKTINQDGVLLYRSLKPCNIGNALSDITSWEKIYFQNGYEDNITANRSLTLSGAVTGSVNYNLSNSSNNALTINTTLAPKTFTIVSQSLSAGVQTSLSSILPDDGQIYLIWITNIVSSSSNTALLAHVQTDIFPNTIFNTTDGDDGRESKSRSLICVPVGLGRYVTVSRASTLIGYMKA